MAFAAGHHVILAVLVCIVLARKNCEHGKSYKHPTKCFKYQVCVYGRLIDEECPVGLGFSEKYQSCNVQDRPECYTQERLGKPNYVQTAVYVWPHHKIIYYDPDLKTTRTTPPCPTYESTTSISTESSTDRKTTPPVETTQPDNNTTSISTESSTDRKTTPPVETTQPDINTTSISTESSTDGKTTPPVETTQPDINTTSVSTESSTDGKTTPPVETIRPDINTTSISTESSTDGNNTPPVEPTLPDNNTTSISTESSTDVNTTPTAVETNQPDINTTSISTESPTDGNTIPTVEPTQPDNNTTGISTESSTDKETTSSAGPDSTDESTTGISTESSTDGETTASAGPDSIDESTTVLSSEPSMFARSIGDEEFLPCTLVNLPGQCTCLSNSSQIEMVPNKDSCNRFDVCVCESGERIIGPSFSCGRSKRYFNKNTRRCENDESQCDFDGLCEDACDENHTVPKQNLEQIDYFFKKIPTLADCKAFIYCRCTTNKWSAKNYALSEVVYCPPNQYFSTLEGECIEGDCSQDYQHIAGELRDLRSPRLL